MSLKLNIFVFVHIKHLKTSPQALENCLYLFSDILQKRICVWTNESLFGAEPSFFPSAGLSWEWICEVRNRNASCSPARLLRWSDRARLIFDLAVAFWRSSLLPGPFFVLFISSLTISSQRLMLIASVRLLISWFIMPSGTGARDAHLGGQLRESGSDGSRYLCSVNRRWRIENCIEYPVLSAKILHVWWRRLAWNSLLNGEDLWLLGSSGGKVFAVQTADCSRAKTSCNIHFSRGNKAFTPFPTIPWERKDMWQIIYTRVVWTGLLFIYERKAAEEQQC